MGDEYFRVISQSYHIFSDASRDALGASCYSLTNYLAGPPTVRLLFSKCRVTPKGKNSMKTIPRLELASNLLATEVAQKVGKSYGIPDVKSVFTF